MWAVNAAETCSAFSVANSPASVEPFLIAGAPHSLRQETGTLPDAAFAFLFG